MMRRTRRDVIEQLPARRDTVMATGLTPAQRTVHDQLEVPIARIARKGARGPLSQAELQSLLSLLGRQRIACNGMAQVDFPDVWPSIERRAPSGALLDSLASPKLGELRELVSAVAIAQERKVVVFSQWQRMLRLSAWAVSDLLPAADVRAVFLGGEESSRQRTQKVAAFRDQADVRVLFATDAAGVGLDLRRAASCCIHLDMPWNPAVLEQRTRWIGRLGQERPVDTWVLVAEDGIEGRIAALARHEPAHFGDVFDGTSDTVELDRAESFLSRLESVLPGASFESDGDIDAPEGRLPAIDDAGADDIPATAPVADLAPADVVASLVRQIQVTQRSDGRVSLEAPAAVAAAVADLLQNIARLLSDESA
jgi:SNF2 family DNA or RNA helicase